MTRRLSRHGLLHTLLMTTFTTLRFGSIQPFD